MHRFHFFVYTSSRHFSSVIWDTLSSKWENWNHPLAKWRRQDRSRCFQPVKQWWRGVVVGEFVLFLQGIYQLYSCWNKLSQSRCPRPAHQQWQRLTWYINANATSSVQGHLTRSAIVKVHPLFSNVSTMCIFIFHVLGIRPLFMRLTAQ